MKFLPKRRDNKKYIFSEIEPRITVSFYKYFIIINPKVFREKIYIILKKIKVFGRIYISKEGINAQISVPKKYFENLKKNLFSKNPLLEKLRFNIAMEENCKSFWVLRLKIRKRIVADGIKKNFFQKCNIGKYLKSEHVNEMLEEPDTLFVDMRNHYEYEVGHFKNAIEVFSYSFREQLPLVVEILQYKKNNNIVLYCTGGIRCENASSYMFSHGFKNIFHVEGGIIEYVRSAKKKIPIHFLGRNFVFDERIGERISNDVITYCHQCVKIHCDTHTNCKNIHCNRIFIQCFKCAVKYKNCCSKICSKI